VSNEAAEAFHALRREIADLRRLFDDRLSDDTVREKSFDALYGELRDAKEQLAGNSDKSLLLDLLLFYDSVSWFQRSLEDRVGAHDELSQSARYLVEEFLELLYRQDVVPVDGQTRFNHRIHKAVKMVAAEDPIQDNIVTKVLKRGFRRGERTLRPEEVVVARWNGASE